MLFEDEKPIGHSHDVQFFGWMIVIMHYLYVAPIMILVVIGIIIPTLVIISIWFFIFVASVTYFGLLFSSFLIGLIFGVMTLMSIIRLYINYKDEMIF